MSWLDTADNEDGFKIERRTSDDELWIQITTVSTNATSYSDTAVLPTIGYYYRVRAYNSYGNSSYSNEAVMLASGDNWSSIECGSNYSLALKTNGTHWGWGHNNVGQLGLGYTVVQIIIPDVIFGTVSDWRAIAAGNSHSLGLKTSGTIWAWGNNSNGQLGDNTTTQRNTPRAIFGTDSDWRAIAAGNRHSLGLKTNGTLWVWGYNSNGQLGDNTTTQRNTPRAIFGTGSDWIAIAAGASHSLGLKTNGIIWAWGYNSNGQLGDGTTTQRTTPRAIFGTGSDWMTMAAGGYHSLGLKTNGVLWAWGQNGAGQLGDGTYDNRITPRQIGVASDWVKITGGTWHTIALKTSGLIWSWGANDYGQLGLGDVSYINTPTQVGFATDWAEISAGILHTLGRKTNGTLWVWGRNNYGQLGLGDTINRNIPYPICAPIIMINLTTTIISLSQIDLSWNDNSNNENGFRIERSTDGINYALLSTLNANMISYSDTTITAGNTYYYQVKAFNDLSEGAYSNQINSTITPIAPSLVTATVFSAGRIDVTWMDVNGEIGYMIERKEAGGNYAQIATCGQDIISYSDEDIGLLPDTIYYYKIKAFNAGGESEYSIESNGVSFPLPPIAPSVLTSAVISSTRFDIFWDNIDNETDYKIERKLNYAGTYEQIATVGADITSYSDMSSFSAGTYYYRVKAHNIGGDSSYSNEAWLSISGTWSAIAGGGLEGWGDGHAFALKTDGTIWSWGYNDQGQLGLGDWTSRNIPTRIGSESNWSIIASGSLQGYALKINKTLWSWGRNDESQLGRSGDTINPGIIGITSDWAQVYNSGVHCIARKTNGTIWSWGYNGDGQLGLGDTGVNRNTPTQVGAESDWFNVALEVLHNLAIKTNGTLWAWGYNLEGELGLGHYDNRNTPTQVFGNSSDWSAIAAGGNIDAYAGHSIAIKTNKTLWAWGYNGQGQLGLGDYENRNTPSQILIGSDTDWSIIAAGNNHSIACKTMGTLWAWGSNWAGQLGLEDTENRNTPTQIGTNTDWSKIAGGMAHTMAIKNNGTLWVWGGNGAGQLGLGDNTDRNTPTLVGE